MSEGDEPQTHEQGKSDASENPAKGTPPIGHDKQVAGQTQTPAADDDVGVPDDVGGEGE